MRASVALVLVACTKAAAPAKQPPSPRARAELLRAIAAYEQHVHGALPRIGEADYVRPPDDAEIAWIHDRAQPLAARMDDALALTDQLRAIFHAYTDRDVADAKVHPATARDSVEGLAWGEATIRSYANLDDAAIDEIVPTLSPTDTSYAARMEGLGKMAVGQLEMLQGALITLRARRVELAVRAELLATWQQHAASFKKLWTGDDCAKARGWIAEVAGSEPDAKLADGLRALSADLADCRGRAR